MLRGRQRRKGERHRVLRERRGDDRHTLARGGLRHVRRDGPAVAQHDHAAAYEGADRDRVEMVLDRDERAIFPGVAHDV